MDQYFVEVLELEDPEAVLDRLRQLENAGITLGYKQFECALKKHPTLTRCIIKQPN